MNIKIKAALYTLLVITIIALVFVVIRSYPVILIKYILLPISVCGLGMIIYSIYNIVLRILSKKN
jgi:hypothetical protein